MTQEKRMQMIRDIQLETLKSLKVLDRICRKYDLKYFAYCGTMLGAIRHEGFVPWDDDLDIGMMREDFEKLCQVPEEEWGDDTILVAPSDNCPIHDKIFGRVYRKHSVIQSKRDVDEWKDPKTGRPFYTSLMCDIYLFDHTSAEKKDNAGKKKKLKRIAAMYKPSKYVARVSGRSMKEKLKSVIKNISGYSNRLISAHPEAKIYKKYKRIAEGKLDDRYICCYSSIHDYQYTPEEFFPLVEKKFEDMQIFVPKNYDAFLTELYGDYMQFPPEADRYHIQFIYADLGNGKGYIVDPIPGSLGELALKKKAQK